MPARQPASRYANRVTVQQSRTQLNMLLYGCGDEAFAKLTAESLAAIHRLPLKECAYRLQVARQSRERLL